ncbi:MAG: TSUP family transporter [candidate division KSB1 bacterium]|nr:TSUP family transporter [candidate division KSB1 bacterium]MDZ7384496.1 TSUP family transporter [candidate division KSB1 bacterium]MDZ7392793.1 TSUP family transporter [candidate division KSB1 bacterium]MDZ7412697.1 TSUP family transporter [candidate division KSB1 bacterium]
MQSFYFALLGLAAGILGGAFGIGGGALMVPVMVLFMNVEPHTAIGTSLSIIIPISIAATIRHVTLHNVDMSIVIPGAIGGILGGVIGATIIASLPAVYAKKGLAIFMIYMAVRLLLSK